MKLPLFEQDLGQFLSSKSNWVGMASIAVGGWLASSGDLGNGAVLTSFGLSTLGIKDAIAKK